MTAPTVIAHRGACAYRPELTRSALLLAIEQGAPAIEVDLVSTSDGVLVLRHEPELSGTTDVASRPEFAARRAVKEVDGRSMRGWFAEDFTAAELGVLRARERLPRLRPASAAHDGEEPVLTAADALALAAAASVRLVLELKHPARSAALGLPLDDLLVAELAAAASLPDIVLESFEWDILDRLAARGVVGPRVALVGDRPFRDGGALADPGVFAAYDGVSARAGLIRPREVERLRARGLEVWAWTLRPENRYLPPRYRLPTGPYGRYATYWRRLAAAGVTGVFADHPDLARSVLAGPDVVARAYP